MPIMPHPPPDAPIPQARRDPTAARAIGRTASTPAPAAPVPVLRARLLGAIGRDDGIGALLLAAHLARATG